MTRPARRGRRLALCLFLLMPALGSVAAEPLTAANTSRYVGDGRWDWTVYLRGAPEALSRIQCVEYTLHPTFDPPRRKVCERGAGAMAFPLSSNGWGTFEIAIRVLFKSGDPQVLRHTLQFERPAADKGPSFSAGNTSRRVGNSQWDWTVFIQGSEQALDQVACVDYGLHATFPQPQQQVCSRGVACSRAFPLQASGWGTFPVDIRVRLKDGRVESLRHPLRFSDAGSCSLVESATLRQKSTWRPQSACFQGRLSVQVGDIEDEWRKRPFNVQLFVAGARTPRVLNVRREGDSVEFDHAGRRYALTATEVITARGQENDRVGLQICER